MLSHHTQRAIAWIKRVVTQPRGELDRWQAAARFAYDLGRHGAGQLRRDRAPQMAAALAYHTLFGLLPVLVMTTVLVRAIKGVDEFRKLVHELFAAVGLDQVQVIPPARVGTAPAEGTSLAQWLEGLVDQAASLRIEAIGWVGLALVIYAAIGLMGTIENSFNAIYRAPGGRSWTRRLPLYWFVLTVGPVIIGITMYLDGRFEDWISSVDTGQWVLVGARILWNVTLAWLFMLGVYLLVPNTTITLRPALAGSFVAAALLNVWMVVMGLFLDQAFAMSQLYGSLGLIPIFMFWVYVTWLIVLFGLEVSAILQTLDGRNLEKLEPRRQLTGIVDPASVVSVMEVVARGFQAAGATTARHAAEVTALPETTVAEMFDALIEAGLLHRLDRGDGAVSLARPPEQIAGDQLMRIGFAMVDQGKTGRHSVLLERLRQTQLRVAAETTLATLTSQNIPVV